MPHASSLLPPMNAKLHNHVNLLFAAAPKTQRAEEMKEELLANLNEKYDDLLRLGYDSTAAFHISLSGIGDLDELFREFLPQKLNQQEKIYVAQPISLPKRRPGNFPFYLAIAVALFILGPGCVPLMVGFGMPIIGVFCLFLCEATALGILVYGIALLFSKGARQADEYYQRYYEQQLHSLGNVTATPPDMLQNELRQIRHDRILRRIALILAIVFFVFAIYQIGRAAWNGVPKWNLFSIGNLFDANAITPTGPIISQNREIAPLKSLFVSDVFSVVLSVGEKDDLTLETHEDIMNDVITEMKGDTLIVRMNRRYKNVQKNEVRIRVRDLQTLENLHLSGACRFTCEEPITASKLIVSTSGATKTRLTKLDVGNLNLIASGACTTELIGNAKSVSTIVSGAVTVDAYQLITGDCDINASGASTVNMGTVHGNLSMESSGACKISYKGTPTIKSQKTSGVSRIHTQ